MLNQLTRGLGRAARGLAAAAVVMGVVAAAHADEITGAGATFPALIYTKWGEGYTKATKTAVNYQGVGSGTGVTQIINRTIDFGASDAPVAADKLAQNNLLQFPAVIGAVVVVVNIPGVDGNKLNLTGDIVADIYQGKIRMWNDARIKAINAGVNLPAAAIAPAYRADSSGTTNIFTSYLSTMSASFKTNLGAANAVAWKTGVGSPGNAGVAAAVQNTKGGIGYVEYAYATENKMQTPMLQNANKKFVAPTEAGFNAAASQANWATAQNMATSMLNLPGETTWPIVSATYILLPKNPTNSARSIAVMKFFDWAFKNGAPQATALHYVPLPAAVQARVRTAWSQVKDSKGNGLWGK